MGEKTNIEWTNATWNPWYGCHKVSAGCKFCYMFRDMPHYGKDPNIVTRSRSTFDEPLRWAKNGKLAPGSRIFTCSWSDWFIGEADPWRPQAWGIVHDTPQFTYLILTKRPERIAEHLPSDWGAGYPNVWLGVSTENQDAADERIPLLLDTPAAVHFLSCEPLLGPIVLDGGIVDWKRLETHKFEYDVIANSKLQGWNVLTGQWNYYRESDGEPCTDWRDSGIDWVISGGESGTRPRPCDLDWARSLRDQCMAAGMAFFHKQHGGAKKVGGTWGGRELDGRTWDEFPAVGV
jgi:protein gp37